VLEAMEVLELPEVIRRVLDTRCAGGLWRVR